MYTYMDYKVASHKNRVEFYLFMIGRVVNSVSTPHEVYIGSLSSVIVHDIHIDHFIFTEGLLTYTPIYLYQLIFSM